MTELMAISLEYESRHAGVGSAGERFGVCVCVCLQQMDSVMLTFDPVVVMRADRLPYHCVSSMWSLP